MQNKLAIILLAVLSLGFTTKGYKIDGTVKVQSLNGSVIYLIKSGSNSATKKDSVTIKNGRFEFKGVQDKAELYYLSFSQAAKTKLKPLPIILENGKIKATFDQNSFAEGTPLNNTLKAFYYESEQNNKLQKELNTAYGKMSKEETLTPARKDSLISLSDKINSKYEYAGINLINSNLNNVAGAHIFYKMKNDLSEDKQKEIVAKAGDVFKSDLGVQSMINYLKALEKVAVGKQFTDFKMPDMTGKEVKLSDFAGKGKYLLIDFWASWCGPCRAEMPVVVEAYAKYKNKGFEILGVSFDTDVKAWKESVEKQNMTWPQVSDLKGWKCLAAPIYAVKGVPHTILLDREGKIIAKNLRGEKLLQKLEELMK